MWIKPLVPFVRTPANILKAGLRSSPFGLFKSLQKGMSPFERNAIIRRAIGGSVFLTTLAQLMGDGVIEATGTGPKNAKERATWESMGYKPNHIYLNVGGQTKGVAYQNTL